jgi:heat shock protein HslJ
MRRTLDRKFSGTGVTALAAAAIMLFAGTGCDGGKTVRGEFQRPADSAALEGRTFTAQNATGLRLGELPLELSFTDKSLSVNAGCNSMGGRYTATGGALRVRGLFSTEMACGHANRVEEWVMDLLIAGPDARLTGDVLVLQGADGHKLVLRG